MCYSGNQWVVSEKQWVKKDYLEIDPSAYVNLLCIKDGISGFPGGAVVESLPASARDTGSSPGLGGSHMPRSN